MPRLGSRTGSGRGTALVLCLVSTVAVACTSRAGIEQHVTLEVRDGWIREPGTGCAGSRPFLYVHEGSKFEIEDITSGEVVVDGALPEGSAIEAVHEDLGVPRVPTFCRFRFSVSVPHRGDYRLFLDEGTPLEFSIAEPSRHVTLLLP